MTSGDWILNRKIIALCILVAMCLVPVALADEYVGGLPLTTVQTGTVSGDLWFDAVPPTFATSVTKDFTLPAAATGSNVKWARLYVSTYNGHMQEQRHGNITTQWDNGNDGSIEATWTEDLNVDFTYVTAGGNDNTAQGGGLHDPYRTVNDHCTRVTSDYFMWYDVKSLLTTQNVRITAVAKAIGSSFDGRIKEVALVVAYDDGDTDQIRYWVNQGLDSCSYYVEDNFGYAAVGTTSFGTTGLSGISSANLTSVYIASNNGYYGFPTSTNNFVYTGGTPSVTGDFTNVNLDRTPDSQGTYSGVKSWNVTSLITGTGDTTLAYARFFEGTGTAAFFKIPLALLKVELESEPPVGPPVAAFSAAPLSGVAPLNVTFTDQSTNTPTSWAWDFTNDGTIDSVAQNPSYTYPAAGSYTVNLTATNAGGSDSEVKTNYITISAEPTYDLTISGIVNVAPPAVLFARETNNIRINSIKNNGPGTSPATEVLLTSTDGFSARAGVPSLASGATTTVTITDTIVRNTAGGTVTYTATVDPDNTAAETNESNNSKDSPVKTVTYNGYKGKTYWAGGSNVTTRMTFDIRGGLVHSFGDSVYMSGSFGSGWTSYTATWSAADLPIPAGATVREARLYVPYTWDDSNEVPDHITIDFNSVRVPYQQWYHDVSNFGAYTDHVYGLLTYNVTPQFQKNAMNTVIFSREGNLDKLSPYGFTLAVIYEDESATRKQIFLNEEFDILGADATGYATTPEEATAYVPFSGQTIVPADVTSASLITFVPSGNGPEGVLLLNGNTLATNVWDYGDSTGPQVAVDTRDVTGSLLASGNEAGIQSTEGATPLMAASHAFLVVEYGEEAPTASFTASPLSGTAPLEVHFTDASTGTIASYAWDFTNDGIIDSTDKNPVHTYQNAGTYTVNLTVTGQGGSDSEVKAGYITASGASQPDLVITKLSTNLDELFAHESNTINATVRNNGTAASGACTLRIDAAGVIFDVPLAGLAPGAQQEVQVTDTTLRTGGQAVTITASADSGTVVAESDETNNVVSITEVVVNNGYKGKRWTGGSDMTTHATFVGQYDVVYSAGNSVYHATKWLEANATWTAADLPIPAGATIASARLYQSYAYNKMGTDPAFSASFNGNVISPVATYRDIKGYAAYSYPYGLYVYDVTSLFNTAGNTLLLTPEGTPGTTNDYSIYGAYLVVTFIDPATTDKQILINDEFDMVYAGSARAVSSDEATVYANFSELDTGNMAGGTAVAILASAGDSGKSKFFFNSNEYTGFWTDYQSGPQIGFSVYDVTDALTTGVNEARLQSYDAGSGGDNMYAMTTILIVDNTISAPVASFSATPLSGTTPLEVHFTDASTGTIASYAWDFTNDGTIDSTDQNPVHTYQNAGTYTVNLTVTGPGGSDSEVKTGYITASSPGSVNVSFSPQSRTILLGESAEYQIILDSAPQGLAGYDMIVSLQNPGVGEIASAVFPPWATLANATALPNQSVRLMAADLDTQIGPGATNVLLVTISLTGTAAGMSPITINILRMDADGGAAIHATTTDGQVIVSSAGAPVAAFTSDKTTGDAPLLVQFTDQSTGQVVSYAWDFTNDGIVDSTDQNPTYTYQDAGTYTVTLTVTGPGGSDSEVKVNYISVTEPSGNIIADFSAAPLAGDSPLIVRFTDRSTGTITKREWDFNNDGTIDSTARNPIYFYRGPGVYSVRLVVTGPEGTDQEVKERYITVNGASGEITADFSATPLEGNAPLLVRFTDRSTGTITKREWDFNNDGTIDSTARSPIYFYRAPGVYSVRLVVTGPDGSNEMVKEDYITVTVPVETLIARFTQEPRFGPAPLQVTFTDKSAGTPTAYLWSFGDGSTSTEVSPSHTYTTQGLFRVSLTVSNNQGSSTSNGFVFVMRTPRSP